MDNIYHFESILRSEIKNQLNFCTVNTKEVLEYFKNISSNAIGVDGISGDALSAYLPLW